MRKLEVVELNCVVGGRFSRVVYRSEDKQDLMCNSEYGGVFSDGIGGFGEFSVNVWDRPSAPPDFAEKMAQEKPGFFDGFFRPGWGLIFKSGPAY